MKRILCILVSLLLLASGSALAEGATLLNPNGYDILNVTDIFTNEDSEYGENDQEIPHAAQLTIQGTFGTLAPMTAEDAELSEAEMTSETLGFDPDETVCLTLAEGCELLMPDDFMDPVNNVPVTDLQAWYDKMSADCADYLGTEDEPYTFYAVFEMNDDGELTRLEYIRFEWA